MITAQLFYDLLTQGGVGFFAGVPDSLLKSFCAYVTDHAGPAQHSIAVNEGAAVALAAGYHLATGKIPLVYMQNSGIGNAVNPLLSLADVTVYSIPMVLVIGWRGEPSGAKDEPQHLKQGKVTLPLLQAMDIPYTVVAENEAECRSQLDACLRSTLEKNAPHALVIRAGLFAPYALRTQEPDPGHLSREEAIAILLDASSQPEGIYVSTTGMASRELYEIRERLGQGHDQDFLTVGSMGHASQIALGMALQKPDMPVTVLDGDGALLMHLGALAAIGDAKPANFRHIILNNGAHDSVGGQPTLGLKIDIPAIAKGCGYAAAKTLTTAAELRAALAEKPSAGKNPGPILLEIRVRKGARSDLGRPGSTPEANKRRLMRHIKDQP
ncbi:MAG: phosphonopyruvate decarboxylase [Treponema sp.]|jgi:phosphonopyruvate decarboxylase|nr:phosphonopyruvate decarboxylase [Treponema sp.]